MTLSIFNESNGVYSGVNTPQFTQLEYLVNNVKTNGCQIPSLGLFGEASTGKTFSAKLIASSAKYEFLYFNAASLSITTLNKTIRNAIIALMEPLHAVCVNPILPGRDEFNYSFIRPLVILIDEAHELSKDVQTHFLSVLVDKGLFAPNEPHGTFNTDNITWIFATTDSSKLLYPLTTRTFNIIFDQYSKEDIMNIIKLKYDKIESGGLEILAQCSKFVPRVALRFAEQLTNTNPNVTITSNKTEEFVRDFLNMETNGIDPLDKRILLYLAANKKQIAPVDIISLQAHKDILERLKLKSTLSKPEHALYNKSIFNISILENKISKSEYISKSRQDISLACRILDLRDLEVRLSYLEKLEFIVKSNKGISLAPKYL